MEFLKGFFRTKYASPEVGVRAIQYLNSIEAMDETYGENRWIDHVAELMSFDEMRTSPQEFQKIKMEILGRKSKAELYNWYRDRWIFGGRTAGDQSADWSGHSDDGARIYDLKIS